MPPLPPKGPFSKHPLEVGDSAYALCPNNKNQWWPCTVFENHTNVEEYTIIFERSISQKCEIVTGKQLAYSEPSKYMLRVGTRCIGDVRGIFSAAIIAEQPNLSNKNRYLVFFDNGDAKYLSHDKLHMVVKPSEEVWNDVPVNFQEFIKIYLKQIAQKVRAKLVLNVGDEVKTAMAKGGWKWAKVKDVDCLLVKMEFFDHSTEWLYKGSKRFRPIWLHMEELAGRAPLKTAKTKTNKIEVTNWEGKGTEVSKQIRTEPKKLEPHSCDPKCIAGPGLEYKDGDDKGENILLIPILHGWRRVVPYVPEEERRFVFYVAPCGRRLRRLEDVFTYLRMTKSQMEIDFFNCDWWVHVQNEFQLDRTLVNIKDMSGGKENIPIPLVNSVNGEYHEHFQYSTKKLPQKNVHIEEDVNFMICCSCEDDCSDKEKCECRQLTAKTAEDTDAGYSFKRLQENVPTGIYECNSRCRCKHTCLNRVAQQPLRNKFQVFKTAARGWGIRTLVDMPQGAFLCTYVGKLFEERESLLSAKKVGDDYHAGLDLIEIVEEEKGGYESDVTDIEDEEEDNSKSLDINREEGTNSLDKSQVDGMTEPEEENPAGAVGEKSQTEAESEEEKPAGAVVENPKTEPEKEKPSCVVAEKPKTESEEEKPAGVVIKKPKTEFEEEKPSGVVVEKLKTESEEEKLAGAVIEKRKTGSEEEKPVGVVIKKPKTESKEEKPAGVVIEKPKTESKKEKPVSVVVEKPNIESEKEKLDGAVIEKSKTDSEEEKPAGVVIEKPKTESEEEKLAGIVIEKPKTESEKEKPGSVIVEKPKIESEKEKPAGAVLEKQKTEPESEDEKPAGAVGKKLKIDSEVENPNGAVNKQLKSEEEKTAGSVVEKRKTEAESEDEKTGSAVVKKLRTEPFKFIHSTLEWTEPESEEEKPAGSIVVKQKTEPESEEENTAGQVTKKMKTEPESGEENTAGQVTKKLKTEPESKEEKPAPFVFKKLTSVRKLFGQKERAYIMDAKEIGNIGRYLNHSCDPNVFVQNVFVDSHDLRFPWVAFFARKFIKAGDELFWHYHYEIGSLPDKVIWCYCGAKDCKKRLL